MGIKTKKNSVDAIVKKTRFKYRKFSIEQTAEMPPRFNDSFIRALKQTLLPRAPKCFFTTEDVAALHEQTGLVPAQILMWSAHFRNRVAEEQRLLQLSEPEKVNNVSYPVSDLHSETIWATKKMELGYSCC